MIDRIFEILNRGENIQLIKRMKKRFGNAKAQINI